MLLLLPALLAISLPQVQSQNLRPHAWHCTATGMNFENRLRYVFGPDKPTRIKAEDAAFHQCLEEGLSDCRILSCSEASATYLL